MKNIFWFTVAAVLLTSAAGADTDVYGNAIETENGQVTYRFWHSGLKAEDLSSANASTAVCDSGFSIDSRSFTWLSSNYGCIVTRPWVGLYLTFR